MSEVKTQERENTILSDAEAVEPFENAIIKEERELLGLDAAPNISPPIDSGELPLQENGFEVPPPLPVQDGGIDARDREFLAALGAVLENSRQQSYRSHQCRAAWKNRPWKKPQLAL